MGAVGKHLEHTEMRPTSDHTRTGLNAHSDISFLKHTLDTYQEISLVFEAGLLHAGLGCGCGLPVVAAPSGLVAILSLSILH